MNRRVDFRRSLLRRQQSAFERGASAAREDVGLYKYSLGLYEGSVVLSTITAYARQPGKECCASQTKPYDASAITFSQT